MLKVFESTCRNFWCLSSCKKSTSSLTSFLRYWKDIANLLFWELREYLTISIKVIISIWSKQLVILGNMRMPGHAHLKWKYHFEETFNVYHNEKDQLHPLCFPWHIEKILQTCCFGYFGHACLCTPKVVLSSYRKLLRLSLGKKSTSSSMLLWRYCKDIQVYSGYFGYACLHLPKVITPTCRKLQFLSTCKKQTSSFTSFLRY